MCLLFGLTDTTHIPRLDLERLLLLVNSKFAATQRDGFGFAVWDTVTKTPYIERYVRPADFAGAGRISACMQRLGWMREYAMCGDWNATGDWAQVQPGGPMIVHGRTSTNAVNLRNTHPFHKNGWTLVHNGAVDWHGPVLPMSSTCDSEHLLNCYVHLQGPVDFAENLSGWFATMAIDPEGRLHVAKCVSTTLYFAFSEAWQTYIFCTQSSLLGEISVNMQLGSTRPLELEPLVELTFIGNEPAGVRYFNAPAIASRLAAAADKALGRSAANETTTKGKRKRRRKSARRLAKELREANEPRFAMDTGAEGELRMTEHMEEELIRAGFATAADLADMTDQEVRDQYEDLCEVLSQTTEGSD